jgi:hypothetical protein
VVLESLALTVDFRLRVFEEVISIFAAFTADVLSIKLKINVVKQAIKMMNKIANLVLR